MAAFTPLKINNENTCWVFVSGAGEVRHLYDIILGVDVLRKWGVADKDIWIFADHPARSAHFNPFGITTNVFDAYGLLSQFQPTGPYEQVLVVVTGHGSTGGIPTAANRDILVTNLLQTVRSCPGIKGGIVLFAQCYAGLFNYTDSYTTPPLVLIGATSLNPSLSESISLSNPIPANPTVPAGTDLQSWVANIFLYYFFEWLRSTPDVDGDEKSTLMDAYRFAGVNSNQRLRALKSRLHFGIGGFIADVVRQGQLPIPVEPQAYLGHLLHLETLQRRMNDAFENLYLHQEPWILNANFARDICFEVQSPTASLQ